MPSTGTLSAAVGAMAAEITGDLLLEMTGHPEGFDPSNEQDREARDRALAITAFVTECLAVSMDLDPAECTNSGQIAAREMRYLKIFS